jgi:anti-anti-sigma factor
MEFKIEKHDNFTIIQVLNENLDNDIAQKLKTELVIISENGEKNIIIDLSKCTYCDSFGLSALLAANRLCKKVKGNFVLTGLKNAVEKLITISELDAILKIAETHEAAFELIINSK